MRSLPAGLLVAARAAARASREEEEEEEEEEGRGAFATASTSTLPSENDGFGQLDPVRDVSWHPSGTALAAASFDGSITVFGPRSCRRKQQGRGGGSEGVFGIQRHRVAMLPIRDDDEDDEDYEPSE